MQTETPISKTFTQEQLMDYAKEWLNLNYSFCREANPDKYYERLGLLVHFVTDLVPKNPTPQ